MSFTYIHSLTLATSLQGKYYFQDQFTDEGPEAPEARGLAMIPQLAEPHRDDRIVHPEML